MFFSGQFWSAMRAPMTGSAAFESLLRREDVTVSELLQSDEVVAAAKRGHPGLMTLCVARRLKGMRLSDLIEVLTDEGEAQQEDFQARRFPFIASEIINSEVPEVLDLFFSDEVFLDQLFSVLQREEINPVTAGYFSSAAVGLLTRSPAALVQYLFGKFDYSRDLVRHVASRAIADFLLRLLRSEQGGAQFAFDRLRMLEQLCISLTADHSQIFLCNAYGILSDIVEDGKELKGWKVYMAMLIQSQTVATLCDGLSSEDETVARVCGELLGSLLRIPDLENVLSLNFSEISKLLRAKNPEAEEEEPRDVYALLQEKVAFLTERLETEKIETVQTKTQHLGMAKLAYVRLLGALIRNASQPIVSALVHSQTLAALTDLFTCHIWSSLLHCEYESIVRAVIDGSAEDLKTDLLVTANLPRRLVSIEPWITSETGVKTRKGYMGHITRIGNFLLSATTAQPLVASHLTFNSDWIVFVNEVLQVRNEMEDGRLGQKLNENKRYDSEDEFEDAQEGDKEALSTPEQLFQDLQSLVLVAPTDSQEAEDEAFSLEDDIVTLEATADPSDFCSNVYWKLPVREGLLDDLE